MKISSRSCDFHSFCFFSSFRLIYFTTPKAGLVKSSCKSINFSTFSLTCPANSCFSRASLQKCSSIQFTAAICAGPTVLSDLGITDGKKATCYPGCDSQMGSANMVNAAAVTDGKLITGTSAGCAIPFGLALIAALKGQEVVDTIAKQIVIR